MEFDGEKEESPQDLERIPLTVILSMNLKSLGIEFAPHRLLVVSRESHSAHVCIRGKEIKE